MTDIIINYEKGLIEESKKFMKVADKFGSEVYKELKSAREDNPNYRIVQAPAPRKAPKNKSINPM